jgi:alkylation response protein AidB-like acyl-CoA dehydrogenase
MTIELTEEQEMLRASARDLLEKECTELVVREVETGGLGYSPELWRKIAQLGWLGLVLPVSVGGSGMGLVDLAVLCEELGRAAFPGPYVPDVVVAGLAVAELGSDRQKSDLLPGLIAGNSIAVVTLDEPGPGSPGMAYESVSVRLQATSDGEGFVIHGRALFVVYATLATTFLVPARTSVTRHQDDGITLYLVDASAPGITITPLTSLAGDNPCEVALDGVHVTRESILGQADRGWPPLHRSLQVGAVMLSAQMLGAGERLLQLSSDDYATRLRADASAADPYTREYLSRLRRDLDLCRSATYDAARKLAAGERREFDTMVVNAWKASAGDSLQS